MKMMNFSRLLVWAVVLVMPLWFASCKKDGSEAVTPGGSSNGVEGSWKISGMKISDGKDTQDLLEYLKTAGGEQGAKTVACLTDIKITLNSNGKITGTASPNCEGNADDFNPAGNGATWKVSGNKIIITDTDGPNTYDLTTGSNTMTWSILEEDDFDGDGVKEKLTTIIEFKKA